MLINSVYIDVNLLILVKRPNIIVKSDETKYE